MVETKEEFLSRIYVNFVNDKVIIYNNKKAMYLNDKNQQVWTIKTAKNYLSWLDSQDKKRKPEEIKRYINLW